MQRIIHTNQYDLINQIQTVLDSAYNHQMKYRIDIRLTDLVEKTMQDYEWPSIINFEEPISAVISDGVSFNFKTKS
jgi:hypothetical protein